jgi:CBS domain containing-hemolysin-like protein
MLQTVFAFAVPLLVLLNAFFVAIEFALVSVRWTRLEQLVEENVPGSKLAQRLVENLNDSLAATQLGITFTSLALGWVGEPSIGHALQPFFEGLPLPWSTAAAHTAAIVVAFMCITYLHMVLGELVPRAIALQYAERVVVLFAAPLLAFRAVSRPLVVFMRGSGNAAMRLLRVPEPPRSRRSTPRTRSRCSSRRGRRRASSSPTRRPTPAPCSSCPTRRCARSWCRATRS